MDNKYKTNEKKIQIQNKAYIIVVLDLSEKK